MIKYIALLIFSLSAFDSAFAIRSRVCGNRELPRDKVRKFKRHSNVLLCASGVDHYIRQMIPFNYDKWIDLGRAKTLEARKKMQAFRQQEKLIKWSGVIGYQTIETWDWVAWVYGPDPSCGYDEVCSTYKDSNGNTQKTCTQVMRSCYHNEPRTEYWHCSNEVMDFKSQFVRPSKDQWGPETVTEDPLTSYDDSIPNKYDLLPGEVEDVQIFSNRSRSQTIRPQVEVGDAWNKYSMQISPSSFNCVMGKRYKIDVKINTVQRLAKKTPNAFRPPKNENLFAWMENAMGDKITPSRIRLQDTSADMIEAIARHSRQFAAQKELLKAQYGLGFSTKDEDIKEMADSSGFWKRTNVRIRLFEKRFGRDFRPAANKKTNGGDVATGDMYNIRLRSSDVDESMYQMSGFTLFGINPDDKLFKHIGIALIPGEEYEFRVSMYQRGVPFYLQDCNEPKANTRYCENNENKFYSKEMLIPFEFESEYDQATFKQKWLDLASTQIWDIPGYIKGFIRLFK